MRLWHYAMIEFLPDNQLRGQWRECVLIAKDLHEKGTTNHLLINRLMDYDIKHFKAYCQIVWECMEKRWILSTLRSEKKMAEYLDIQFDLYQGVEQSDIYKGWHNDEYLRICYANLLEKHNGVGKSRITDEEWKRLCAGYKKITGETYEL